jgi:hypothetical protein
MKESKKGKWTCFLYEKEGKSKAIKRKLSEQRAYLQTVKQTRERSEQRKKLNKGHSRSVEQRVRDN